MSTAASGRSDPTARRFQAHSVVTMTPQYGQQLLLSILADRQPDAVLEAMAVVETRRETEHRLTAAQQERTLFAAAASRADAAVRRLVADGVADGERIADMAGMSQRRLDEICAGDGSDMTFGEVWVLTDVLGLDLDEFVRG